MRDLRDYASDNKVVCTSRYGLELECIKESRSNVPF